MDEEEEGSAPQNKIQAASKLAEKDKVECALALPPEPPTSIPGNLNRKCCFTESLCFDVDIKGYTILFYFFYLH